MEQNIQTHYGKVSIPVVRAGQPESGGLTHFRINTRYINNTTQIVRAKLRSGLEMSFPAVPSRTNHSHDRQFLVRKELVVGPTCVTPMRDYLQSLDENISAELNAFRQVYLKVYDDVYRFGTARELSCVIEFMFTEGDLQKNAGIFYHDELDTLFKFGPEAFMQAHPNSAEGRKRKTTAAADALRSEYGFIYWIELIDNLGKEGNRFVSICNQVYQIAAKADKNRADGVYIVSSAATNGTLNPNETVTEFKSFEDAERDNGLYRTYVLAASNGDIAGLRKKELQDQIHANEVERQKYLREKQQHDAEMEEKNRELKNLEHERMLTNRALDDLKRNQEFMADVQRLHLKDQMEKKSTDRKDTSELIKFLPTILAGVGTLLMAWKALRTTQ